MTEPLLEYQAWSILALAFKRPIGLCGAIAHLCYADIIAGSTRGNMLERVSALPVIVDGTDKGFCWPTLPWRPDEARAAFCEKQRRQTIINLSLHERVNNPPHLTEGQAWNVLRLVFGRPPGLCRAIAWLDYWGGIISVATADTMRARFAKLPQTHAEAYCWPVVSADIDPMRYNFCTHQAQEHGVQ